MPNLSARKANAKASAAQVAAPWTYADVGNVGIAGSASYSSDARLTVNAAGADIWGTADSFGYVYQPFVGDGYALVRVYSLQNTDTFAKAARGRSSGRRRLRWGRTS